MTASVDLVDVLFTAAWLIVVTIVAVLAFRSMDAPRLRLELRDGQLRTTRRHILTYVVSIPVLLVLWLGYFTLLVFFGPADTAPETLLVMPSALVIGVRVLAHLNSDAAYHLGSVVPMVIIAAILIGQGVPDTLTTEDFEQSEDIYWAFGLVLVVEYLTTTVWYWRKTRRPGFPGPDPRLPRRQRRFGSRYSQATTSPDPGPDRAGFSPDRQQGV